MKSPASHISPCTSACFPCEVWRWPLQSPHCAHGSQWNLLGHFHWQLHHCLAPRSSSLLLKSWSFEFVFWLTASKAEIVLKAWFFPKWDSKKSEVIAIKLRPETFPSDWSSDLIVISKPWWWWKTGLAPPSLAAGVGTLPSGWPQQMKRHVGSSLKSLNHEVVYRILLLSVLREGLKTPPNLLWAVRQPWAWTTWQGLPRTTLRRGTSVEETPIVNCDGPLAVPPYIARDSARASASAASNSALNVELPLPLQSSNATCMLRWSIRTWCCQ